MPDAECPDQSAWNKKSSCCEWVSGQGWFILFRTHELTWMYYESNCWKMCVWMCFAIIEWKHRLSNWDLSIFPLFFGFVFFLDQLCRTERQVRLPFFSRLDTIIRMESALKVSPINHNSNRVALTFSCTSCTSHAHMHSRGKAGAQGMLPGKTKKTNIYYIYI